jgi:hypothetical protein
MNFTEIQIAKTFINIMKYYLISYFDENVINKLLMFIVGKSFKQFRRILP